MAPFPTLTKDEVQIVHEWLRTKAMPVNRLLHRDYSDGVLVAKLLKKMYPKLVDVHNYQTRYSRSLKAINWETLNFKVLGRLGLQLTKEQITELAKGESGIIERFMWGIMHSSEVEKPSNSKLNRKPLFQRKPISIRNIRESSRMTLGRDQFRTRMTEIPCLSRQNSFTSNLTPIASRNSERIGDGSKPMSYSVFENALNEVRIKVATLEDMLKERDNDIKVLMDRVKIYENENREFRKAVGAIKTLNKQNQETIEIEKSQEIKVTASTIHSVRSAGNLLVSRKAR